MPPSTSQARPSGNRSTSSQAWQQRDRGAETAASRHQHNDGQFAAAPENDGSHRGLTRSESWIELASQPSTSSLSSLGDEIVTTGLRVGSNSLLPQRRRRLPQHSHNHMPSTYIVSHASAQADASSQEEYDETESEEDGLMSSSAEQITPLPKQETTTTAAASQSEDDDDENSTALGVRRSSTSTTFRPQPNVFSHPPSHLQRNATSPSVPQHPPARRPSMSHRSHTARPRGPHFMSPSYQADNDEDLRASLTTLLSCARAAGLRKSEEEFGARMQQRPAAQQPTGLRIVSENELIDEPSPPGPSSSHQPKPSSQQQTNLRVPPHLQPVRTASNSSAPSVPESTSSHEPPTPQPEKVSSKRPPELKSSRAAKKKRTASPTRVSDGSMSGTLISPTVLTWVVSAGVLVLVVGFGAASFVIGREVGRQEGAAGLTGGLSAGNNASCAREAREVIRGGTGGTLRRLKWGGVGRSIVA